MRLIKAFLVGAAGLFIIITLFSLLIPSKVMVSRAVLISNTNEAEVYQQIANVENWKKWHPVFVMDSARLYRDELAAVGNLSGFRIVHHQQNVHISLLASDSTVVKFLMQAKGENDIENEIIITPIADQLSVQVEWRTITKLHWYPWQKFYGIFIDQLTGPGYETSLNGLKVFIEKGRL